MADLSKELNKELNKDFAYCEDALGRAENAIGNLPSVQPEKRTEERAETHACDLIDRQAAIDALAGMIDRFERILADIRETKVDDSVCGMCEYDGAYIGQSGDWCNECPGFDKDNCFKLSDRCRKRWMGDITLPSVQPEKRTEERTETHACDLIDRQAAIDAIYHHLPSVSRTRARTMLHEVPSAQPERTCVSCGRTINNGGWYADGGTRCPIEEHYALPKDGYCHLWEKRSVTDDDYPERREE